MGIRIQPQRPGVAARVSSLADLHVGHAVVRSSRGPRAQPVLRARVAVAELRGRQPGHGVVEVRDAELGAGLGGDEVCERGVPDARRAVGEEVDRGRGLLFS